MPRRRQKPGPKRSRYRGQHLGQEPPNPYAALAAAVIKRACTDWMNGLPSYTQSAQQRRGKDSAREQLREFLEGDMWPFAEMIGLDPETNLAYQCWARTVGLVSAAADAWRASVRDESSTCPCGR